MTVTDNVVAILQRNVLVALKLRQEYINQGVITVEEYNSYLEDSYLTTLVENELASAEIAGVLTDIATSQDVLFVDIRSLGVEQLQLIKKAVVNNLKVLGIFPQK